MSTPTTDIVNDGGLGVVVRSNFLQCPACEDDDVILHIHGETVDAEIECESCEAGVRIR